MPATKQSHVFLRKIEENPQPGPYADAIQAAEKAGTEYWGIWNILAFRTDAAYHLCELSHQVMFEKAPLGHAMRELIAAYTSSLNRCDFCKNAHAAVASRLYGSEEFVRTVLDDPEKSSLDEREKALLRFVRKLTLDSGAVTEGNIEALKCEGWDEAAIYYAIYACALFNFYNRFVSGNGVKLVSDAAFRRLSERMARSGYTRERPASA
jgi:uncharacterized peroxidase-related enzyme